MKANDLLKISQALERTYTMLAPHSEGLEQMERAKQEWKHAFVYVLSRVFR
ncbi:hypothetical protein GGR02_003077 [Anoxybacillus voinovskiensis]|uniref:Uncharacterized protein n=1 Tax=Anoxybacteroides voinovskiense TaxID=230470 RepID=A0A840DZ50_9BACL|nr:MULTISPECIES: hypothetical protein [Anoxybacillus]MBB4075258.1 hypothetical protein [Anoxybacillus voinovskiensis]MCL6586477.1 hypothetical protein [Anoxybacillus sp.]GGJ77522.1 hypothetical protein GCM10008982_28630 [Anoxybacillus voinovskiensis]